MTPNGAAAAADTDAAALAEKVALLSRPAAYGAGVTEIERIETHMSFVFVAGEAVYKLKKPVAYSFLDFSTGAARERACREEVRLNRRLAPEVYLGVSRLTREADGTLAVDGRGPTVDWLVRMRRLPRQRMLDRLIETREVTAEAIDAVAALLARFYRGAARGRLTADEYVDQLRDELAASREAIGAVGGGTEPPLLARVQRFLDENAALLRRRVADGRIVDGHGDLRPEHVCLVSPPVVIDCLEFNERLREVDPFDEIAYLGLECARLGAPWIAPRLRTRLSAALGDEIDERLSRFYAGYRACVRARLALAHLADAAPREPERWRPLARAFLSLGEEHGPVSSAVA